VSETQAIQLPSLRAVVRRRLAVMVSVAGVVLLGSILLAALLPNRYEAWTTLLVAPQTVSKRLVEPGVEDSDLNNRLHLMTMQILSRGRLSKVIDDLQLYPEESQEMTREEVIEIMRDDIRVEPVLPEMGQARRRDDLEINTFRLYYSSHSAQTAAAVAQRLANDFIDEHIRERVETSTGTSEFIEAELERLATAIRGVEERIAQVKQSNAGRLPEDLDANQRLLERAIGDLRLAQRDVAIAESDAAFYRQQALTGAFDRYRGAAPDTPLERKQRLEIALGEARARGLTDKHPDIIAYNQEIAELTAKIEDAQSDEDTGLSTDQAIATNEAQRAELRAQSARAEIARMQAQVAEIEDRLGRTPQVAEQLAALEREHEHLYASFQDFSSKRLDAGVAANMERRQKGEQFRVLETAFPPPAPASPKRLLIIALGFMLALAAGVASGLLAEVVDTSVHEGREAQEAFGIPVLASIPRVKLEWDRVRERRRRVLAIGLGLGLAAVTLLGAGAGYWLVNGPESRAAEAGPAGGGAARPAPEQG
jgi:polysaccharide chain length determinant protein (PEP-CTERM system associated)